jgi:23S rRNA pseudouridine2605 synthase
MNSVRQIWSKTKMADRKDSGAEGVRLHKVLAHAGVASRRAVEEMIRQKRVRVNGKVVTEMGLKIVPEKTLVEVDGRKVRVSGWQKQEKIYLLLNKPPQILTSTRDDRGRRTVMDLVIGATQGRIYPVGRLDFDAQGAILMTNDGDMAHRLTHPKYHVPKTYAAKVKGVPPEESLEKLRRGIYLEDGPCKAAHVEILDRVERNTWVEITVTEGRNRLIKRMFWRIRHPVMRLVRTSFANLTLDNLDLGESRMLTKKEVRGLSAHISK